MIALTPTKEKFQQGVSFAKQIGCKFDGNRKVWLRTEESLWAFVDAAKRRDQSRESYLRANGLEILTSPAVGAADTYRGQASMDTTDSIF